MVELRRIVPIVGIVLLGLLAAVPASAQTTQYVGVYVDADDDSATGCDAQGFSGAEFRLTVTLTVTNTPSQAAEVSAAEYQECVDPVGDVFGAAVAVSGNGTPPWPVGVGAGIDGSDVIEAYIPRDLFPNANGVIRVGIFSGDGDPPGDTMYVTLGGGSDPILIVLAEVLGIPTLSEWMLLALALLLAASALLVLRRRPARMAMVVLLLALALSAGGAGVAWAACVMDGMIDDWAGDAPLAHDPTADATGTTPDLRAFFGKDDGDVVCLRIDAFIAFNVPPTISDVADQVIAEDSATGALAFTVGDTESAATDLVVVATSSNQVLVPDGNITLGGAGANRTVTVTPVADGNGMTEITLTVTDPDGGSASTTFLVTVTSDNDPPTISPIGNQGILEDSTTGALAFTVDDTETAAGSLTLTGGSSDTSIIPNANIVFGGSGMNRTVTVTPAADANGGPVTITVTVQDGDGGSVPEQFEVTVTPVNDEPTLTLGGDQVVDEDAGAQSVANFATTSPGPANEAGQTVSLDVSNDNNALFSAQPAIDAVTGELTYTPAANASGSATVTVVAMDDGGTANGGDDTAPAQMFQITVNAVNDPPTADDEVVPAVCNILGVVEAAPGETADAGAAEVFRTVTDNVLLGDSDLEDGLAVTIVEASGLPGGTTDSTAPFSITTDQGGSLTLYLDGSFIYTPEAGDRGVADSFTYTIEDTGGAQATGTVTLNVGSACIWFVDNTNNGGTDDTGTGTSSDPFTSLVDEAGPDDALADDAEDASLDGDVVYVFEGNSNGGDAYAGGYVTEDNEQIFGEGVDLVVDLGSGPETLFDSTTNNQPTVAGGAEPGFTTTDGTDVEIAGFLVTSDVAALEVTSTVVGVTTYDLHDNTFDAGTLGVEATATAGSLEMSVDGNTDIVADGTAALFFNATGGTITITSLCGNTVHGDTVGTGILATGVEFDADPATGAFEEVECTDGTVIGDSGNRVGGGGLVLTNVTGDLDLGPLSAFVGTAGGLDDPALQVGGVGVFNAAGGTGFQLTTDSGILDSIDGPAVDIDPVSLENMVLTTVASQNSNTVGIGLTDVSGSFQVTGTTTISSTTGDGVAVTDSSAAVTFTGQLAISSTGGEGVSLDDHTGSFSAADTTSTITGTTGDAFNSFSSVGNITYAGTITNTANNSVDIRDHGGAAATTILFSGNIDDDGAGIFLDNNDQTAGATINFTGGLDLDTGVNAAFTATNGGTVNVASGGVSTTADTTTGTLVNIANTTIGASGVTFDSTGKTGGANGILLTNVGGGAFVSDAGSIASQTSRAVDVAGGSGNVTIDNTLSTTAAGRSVEVTGHSGGTVDFNGAITDSGLGIHLDSNTGSILRFDGGMTVDIAGTEEGFNATGGGTVHVMGTNTIDTVDGTGIAVNIASTTIGEDDVTFRSVSANGAVSGIVLDTTGTSGAFEVTGTGTTDESGGVIDDTTGDAVVINTADTVILRNMRLGESTTAQGDPPDSNIAIAGDAIDISDSSNLTFSNLRIADTSGDGIKGTGVTNLSLSDSEIFNVGLDAGSDESAFDFGDQSLAADANLLGTVTITSTVFDGMQEFGVNIYNDTGNLDLTITGGRFSNQRTNNAEAGILVETDGTATMDVSVTGITCDVLEGAACVFAQALDGTMDLTATGNTAQDGGSVSNFNNTDGFNLASGDGTLNFDISNNVIQRNRGHGVRLAANFGGVLNGQVTNNDIDGDGPFPPAASAQPILVQIDGGGAGDPSAVILIDNNDIDDVVDTTLELIDIEARDGVTSLDITVTNNDLNQDAGATLGDGDHGIEIRARDSASVRAIVSSNTVSSPDASINLDVEDSSSMEATVVGNTLSSSGDDELQAETEDAGTSLCLDLRSHTSGVFDLDETAGTFTLENFASVGGDNGGATVDVGAGITADGGTCIEPASPTFP